MSARNPNRASTVYLGNDGDWHGRVTMGFRDNGAPDRRHVRGKTKSEVVKKVRALERLRDEGAVQRDVALELHHDDRVFGFDRRQGSGGISAIVATVID